MRTFKRPVFLILAGLLLVACGPTPTATPQPTVTPTPTLAPAPSPTPTVGVVPQAASGAAGAARIRVIQAAPQSGALDIYLEQALIAGRMGHGAYTNPTSVEAGVYYLQAVPTGARPSTQVLAETTANLEAGQSYLILVAGTAETLNFAVFQEDLSPLPPGQARLAFVHAVPRGVAAQPRVDDQLYPDVLDFGLVSASYIFGAGTHQLSLVSGDMTVATLDTTLAPQQMHTAVLLGQVGGGSEYLLLFSTPVELVGQVRFIHAAPNIPPVTVVLDERSLAEVIPFHTVSDWQELKPRSYAVQVTLAGVESSLPPVETHFNLAANQAMEILLLEDRGSPVLRVYAHSVAPTAPGAAHLVVVNAAPDAPAIYAHTRAGRLAAIPMVPAGANSRVLDFPASRLELLWLNSQGVDTRVVEWAGEVTFLEGYSYTYVVTGADRDPFLIATEVGVDHTLPGLFTDETPVSTEPERVLLRAFNALAEPLNVRIRLGDLVVVDDLANRQSSDPQPIPPGVYTLRVGPPGEDNAPAYYVGELPLTSVLPVTLFVYGSPEAPAIVLLPDYTEPGQPGQAVIRIIHAVVSADNLIATFDIPGSASADSPTLAVPPIARPTATPGPLSRYESIAFGPGQTSGFVGLPASTYDIFVRRASDNEVVAIVPRLTLESRTAYDLLLLPGSSAGTYEVILLPTALEE